MCTIEARKKIECPINGAVSCRGKGKQFSSNFPKFRQNHNFSGSDKELFGKNQNFSGSDKKNLGKQQGWGDYMTNVID